MNRVECIHTVFLKVITILTTTISLIYYGVFFSSLYKSVGLLFTYEPTYEQQVQKKRYIIFKVTKTKFCQINRMFLYQDTSLPDGIVFITLLTLLN